MKAEAVASKCKLEEFNSCPGPSLVSFAPADLKCVDITGDPDIRWYVNEHDTLVFEIPDEGDIAEWMEFVAHSYCDEFDIEEVDGKKIVRMWWD